MNQALTQFAAAVDTADVQPPLVTVVIVNHNYGRFIETCIGSVDRQDYPHIQCIVLDCASSDDSVSVIEEAIGRARNSFFRLLRRDVNQGHMTNALSVLDDIKGVFVTFLDADDLLFPEFVSTHVKAHLNDLNSAAVSVTDMIQIDAAGQVLAGTCHWHQKWRAFVEGSAWTDLTEARSWTAASSFRLQKVDLPRLSYVPAWWSSWPPDRWIWSATSGLMFRRSVVESLAPSSASKDPQNLSFDGYFARFAHSVGGTLVIDSAQGAYRRHGRNFWSGNPVLGGQTTNGVRNELERFRSVQKVASQVVITKHRELMQLLGGDLYYSVAWQLMSNSDFLDFVRNHEKDRAVWEKTIRTANPSSP
jgi:glycosyltransferase involved in cell wall biosynthesis